IFIASLGACAGIYAKSFCDARKLSTDHMHLFVGVVFKKGQKLMEQINITLNVDEKFPEKYIKPIIKSMNSCAVKNQLHPDITFNTSVIYPDK
ncbi:MAG: OsmC family protein, partial [Proteobacteria bacterium]|nr:OsmC family protein [Pseudomonadota bacterium]